MTEKKSDWDKYYTDQYSPAFNSAGPLTGLNHEWEYREHSHYYDSIYECSLCGARSYGWNLWKEHWEPRCTGKAKGAANG